MRVVCWIDKDKDKDIYYYVETEKIRRSKEDAGRIYRLVNRKLGPKGFMLATLEDIYDNMKILDGLDVKVDGYYESLSEYNNGECILYEAATSDIVTLNNIIRPIFKEYILAKYSDTLSGDKYSKCYTGNLEDCLNELIAWEYPNYSLMLGAKISPKFFKLLYGLSYKNLVDILCSLNSDGTFRLFVKEHSMGNIKTVPAVTIKGKTFEMYDQTGGSASKVTKNIIVTSLYKLLMNSGYKEVKFSD